MFKKHHLKIRLAFVIFLILLLNKFLKEGLDVINFEKAEIHYLLKIGAKMILCLLTLWLIKKNNFQTSNKNNIIITVVGIVIFCFSLFTIQKKIPSVISFDTNLLFLLSCLAVALFEELFFRVFIFNALKRMRYKSFKLILITSIVFGLAHLVNFFNTDYEKLSVFNQVVFAFSIGLLLQSIYVKFKSITICIVIHTIINYFGTYKARLIHYNPLIENTHLESSYTFTDFIGTFLALIIITGIFILPISYLLQKHVN
ncbi:CPBP family intramembrane glutamic endopeptidase [Capnocytophaga canis]|uniref:Putative membrane peptidase ydiL n=1 Tax=Capnocytophaga canis TaxID=1848903 RepID=A0A0B7IUB4_9FLAO|nr:CPBP family intramembrane glutamic endopeptidase [Capnocytophaga canis]CEN54179.1 putative membrane peptidase ydiL [Capnocytophaga canis]